MRSIAIAVLAAAVAAAAQLGLGYGLGIISWVAPSGAGTVVTEEGAWAASLAWATWVATTSVVVGAVSADRYAAGGDSGLWVRVSWRLVITLAATIGGLVTVPLVAVPASAAQLGDNFAPHLLASVHTVAGTVLGIAIAFGALASRAVAANVFATAAWLWVLAIVAVVDGFLANRGLGTAQLGVWRFTEGGPMWDDYYIPGALLMLGAALLIGGLAAFPAANRGEARFGVAISGAVGPLIVAVAYVLTDPASDTAPVEQMSAYLTAPYTVLAGLAGSVLVAIVGIIPARRRAPTRSKPAPASATATVAATPEAPAAREYPGGLATATVSGKASVPASSRATPGT
jgi:hypothetical protein